MTASTGQSLVESNERDLQDNLDKMLKSTAVTEHLVRDMMKQGDYAAVMLQLDELSLAAVGASVEVREYMLNLATEFSVGYSFSLVLSRYLAQYEMITRQRIRLSISDEGIDIALSQLQFTQLLRIIQEVLTSIRKRADVENIQVMFSLSYYYLHVIISDDGPEFDTYNSPTIAGLDILREHVALAGMGMELHSQPGQGAQVTVYASRVHPDVVHSQLFIRAMLQQTEAPDSERVTIAKRVLRNAGLSNQQIGIMERVATGQIYRNIAAAMQISESNVKYHIERIQRKLGLSARSGIIETAYEVGLVPDRRKGAKT